ncbi:MAG TPA: NAD(P)-dependent oxidoreductase [Candidatus Rubrimentiphilum sp.]|nr:NAD(P)-dependent oxidoreductase [Candidatus Rubrimentiphilum sp.]
MANSPGTALVTGASGLVGSAVVNALLREGWRVLHCSRRKPGAARSGVTWLPYDLSWTALPDEFGAGADVLVHAALAKGESARAAAANMSGTRSLLEVTRRNGVERRIFISSFAAGSGAESSYGVQKRELEKLFGSPGDAIVRPGLVIGNGGLFRSLCLQLRRRAVLPLIDGGKQPMQSVLDDDLAGVIVRIANARVSGTFTVAEPSPVEYRVFWQAVGAAMNTRIRFVAIPFRLAMFGAEIGDRLHIAFPIGRDQLLGLKAMRFQEVTRDARIVPEPLRTYRESIATVVPEIRG